jgi:hypothetical protein
MAKTNKQQRAGMMPTDRDIGCMKDKEMPSIEIIHSAYPCHLLLGNISAVLQMRGREVFMTSCASDHSVTTTCRSYYFLATYTRLVEEGFS